MYFLPEKYIHKVSKTYRFKPPRDRHHEMTVAYCDGGPVLNDATQGLTGYVWQAYLEGDKIMVKREDHDTPHHITTKAMVTQLDITVDQNMRAFLTYVAAGRAYYYHFNAEDSSYSEVVLPETVKFPRCELDVRELEKIPESDIILGYIREGNLCYRLQRERFLKEHIILTDEKKTMLWRVGNTTDGRFGYHWR